MEMDNEIYAMITEKCDEAESFVDNLNYNRAIKLFEAAFNLIPTPKTDWEAGTWILTAIGDTYFQKGDYDKANQFLRNAEIYPEGTTNSFLLLRIGQSFYELKNSNQAKEYLLRAYLINDESIFDGENPKYRNSISDLIAKDITNRSGY